MELLGVLALFVFVCLGITVAGIPWFWSAIPLGVLYLLMCIDVIGEKKESKNNPGNPSAEPQPVKKPQPTKPVSTTKAPGKSTSVTSTTNTYNNSTKISFRGELSDSTFPGALAKGGKIYCVGFSKNFEIGTYEQKSDGKWSVREKESNCIIAEIDESSREISLNSFEHYKSVANNYSSMGLTLRKMPNEFIMRAASWNGLNIFDNQTGSLIATFDGDAVAASAAFSCMVYEVLMYNKYYRFFHDWIK